MISSPFYNTEHWEIIHSGMFSSIPLFIPIIYSSPFYFKKQQSSFYNSAERIALREGEQLFLCVWWTHCIRWSHSSEESWCHSEGPEKDQHPPVWERKSHAWAEKRHLNQTSFLWSLCSLLLDQGRWIIRQCVCSNLALFSPESCHLNGYVNWHFQGPLERCTQSTSPSSLCGAAAALTSLKHFMSSPVCLLSSVSLFYCVERGRPPHHP